MFFVLLAWGILGMASLVIDWGYVNLTRVQMQSMADAGAVEGIRLRDVAPADPVGSDLNRRIAVSQLASWTYDDDFDLSSDTLQFGAGPDVTLSGGQTDLNALQTLSVPVTLVYKPTLQWNEVGNVPHGDQVSGAYGIPDPGCPTANPGIECADYTRKDFVPADVSTSPTANAFLVRLRRSVKPAPWQDPASLDSISGVSSAGPTLPLTFGLGSTLQAQSNPPGVRLTGLTVRATAIADARPARGVGLPDPLFVPPRLGVTPFGLDRLAWSTGLSVGTPASGNVSASGEITVGGVAIGRFLTQVLSIGEPVQGSSPQVGPITMDGYAPLYQDILGTERIVGFARIEMVGTTPGAVQIIKHPSQVAVENATSTIQMTFPNDLQSQEMTVLFDAHRTLQAEEALLAPVLVR